MSSFLTPSRRVVLAGIAALPALEAGAAWTNTEDRAADLAQRLSEMQLPYPPARLDLLRYSDQRRGGGVQVEAVVQLTWAPGVRSRMLRVEAPDYEAGIEAVELRAYELFANPR